VSFADGHDRGNALLDHSGAPAILDLVEQRAALALAAQQGARDRRPAEDRGVSEVEDVVETIGVEALISRKMCTSAISST